ncbi:MAG: TnsA endonuclease N-terminal domain-containing protein [Planctomycetaceae bacterium]|nr:Tn7 transposase TnsA N-terminal domain-containing protein [Planctomycetales bacterium]MCB9875878.1 TnsA endonuclease N-terminal domain-containing protein [Planctomycetaceae bacterium]MCB9941251.1 TnsA endonuclease N-terminal domain-containing protein [Planctomycetaceae bacterium]
MKIWYGWNESRQGTQIRLLEQEPKTRRDRTTGERYSYVVPDFLVSMLDGTYLLIEVKPSRKLATEVVQRKLAVAATLAANREWSFHVVTERELFRTPLVRNLSFVARYRLFAENPAISAQLLHQVTEEGIQFGKLIGNSSCELLSSKQHALHLLASEQLSFDPVLQELTNSSRVYPKSVISWDPFDLAWASSFYSMDGPIVWSANSPTTATLPKTQNST